MKSQFLKIAGVKSEKAFYKKYPTEAAFFKAHPEAKKMVNGGVQNKGQIKKLQQLTDFGNPPIAQVGGVYTENGRTLDPNNPADAARIEEIKAEMRAKEAELAGIKIGSNSPQLQNTFGKAVTNSQSMLPFDSKNPLGLPKGFNAPFDPTDPNGFNRKIDTTLNVNTSFQGLNEFAPKSSTAKLIGDLTSAQRDPNGYGKLFGEYTTKGTIGGVAAAKKAGNSSLDATSFIQPGMDIIKGIGMLAEQKRAKQEAKQNSKLTGVMAQAAATREEPIRRQYVRPEDVMIQPEQLFPSYGVGTNVLAQDGAMIGGNPTEIQNTFAPNTIYSDMGYEPLNDSDRLKAYYHGGNMRKAEGGLSTALNSGGFADFMNEGGGDLLSKLTSQVGSGGYGSTAGNTIGGGIGQAAGTIFGGPVGGMIGKALGNVVGGFIDPTGRQIKEYNDLTNQNMGSIVAQYSGQRLQNQFGSYMEDGGYVSNDWTPQLITKFGEYNLSDLLQPPHDADMLRAGGHLRSYTPPSERAMYTGREQFAMGGDLKVYRGEAETMSYNPYLPEGGETIMFRGPSHDNGGMPIEYGSSPVEVEGGEPAVKLKDGTSGDNSLVVYGNLVNPKTGKKFKRDAAEISKNEAKQNKKIDKASKGLDNLDVNTSFDKLGMDTYNAIITGANMKLKKYAEDKMDLAALQSAINDTAEEYSLIADDLAKGKVKFDTSKDATAKYGKSLPKAAKGAKIDPVIAQLMELIKQKGIDFDITSTLRPGDKTAQGRDSGHASDKAADVVFPKLKDKAYEAIKADPEIVKFMMDNGLTAINEYDPDTLDITKGSGPHIHFGYDKGTAVSDKFRKEVAALYGDPEDVKYGGADPKNPVYSKKGVQPGFIDYNEIGSQGINPLFASEDSYKNQWLPKVNKAFDDPETAKKIVKAIEEYDGPDAEDVKARLAQEKTLSGKIAKAYELGSDYKPGPYHNILNSIVDIVVPPSTTNTTTTTVPVTTTQTTTKGKFPWMPLINQAIDYLRPSDAEALDPNQLLGEFYAMTNNQLEPVQAQKYNPQLLNPYDISLQDQLNANQSDFNAMQRQIGGDSAALSALAAQKYAANSRVLGEQMRINQANKAGIYNANINTMNDAQLKNLDILDRQYGRQAQAKSNTKATTQAALNSISSKYAQNKLDNRTLATYENLYNYRYDPRFRAQNMNPLANFNMPTVTTNLPIYDTDGKTIIGYQRPDGSAPAPATPPYVAPDSRKTEQKSASATARNGSIVKALKNL